MLQQVASEMDPCRPYEPAMQANCVRVREGGRRRVIVCIVCMCVQNEMDPGQVELERIASPVCVCVCVYVCVRACVRACMCACVRAVRTSGEG